MRTRRRGRIASGAAIALVFALGTGGWQWSARNAALPPVLRFATEPGEMRRVELADGSSLQLSGGTRVAVSLGRDRREARLDSGEAYFDIAHDPARPFSVHTGATDVRVLGTAFDLGRMDDQVALAVYRGAVRFSSDAAALVVKAGYRTRYHDGKTDGLIPFDPAQPDWRLGWLDTQGMKLGDLVAVLNRQTGAAIAAPPASLTGVSVSGRFRLDNAHQLLTAIGSVDGFAVVQQPDGSLKIVPSS